MHTPLSSSMLKQNACKHMFLSMNLSMRRLPSLLHLLLLSASFSLLKCTAIDTISPSKPLRNPDYIVSSGHTFKLGFFSPENTTNTYVGIMYYHVPGEFVVWVANRDKPLNDSSGILTVSEDGNLVVLNGKKEILWSSNASNAVPNSTAQLRDDGNLVLRDNSNRTSTVWESFEALPDTFLPGMRIGVVKNKTIQLTSWRSPSDPAIGNFTYGINPLRIPELFVWDKGVLYWRSGPWDGNAFIGLPETGTDYQSRYDHWVHGEGKTEYLTYDYEHATSLLHYHLNFSGDIQGKVLNSQRDWKVIFSSMKSDCDVYGKCGPNGICNPKVSPICSCLEGFEAKDEQEWTEGNWSGGCLRKELLLCDPNRSAGQKMGKDSLLHLKNVKIPDLPYKREVLEVDCGNECLKNCSCSAYAFVVSVGCLHWADNLIDIQQFSRDAPHLYIRLAYSKPDYAMSKLKKKAIIASTVSVGGLLLAASLYLLRKWRIKQRGRERKTEVVLNDNPGTSKFEELPLYSYETIANATDDFHTKNKLGEGGFGPVYKGKLFNGQVIAVKRLSNCSSQGIKEFMNEVTVISKLQHRNLVKLLGCCVERTEQMLVYEYMPNKSLDAYLFDAGKQDLLDWTRRFAIIEGIGRGLLYLHRDSRLRIIHRDLKASNILLDEDLNPKISDFGLARIFGGNQDQANTNRVVGTYGYMAPEYAMGGKFSEKSDVYSFGVLILEVVSGKRNTSFYHDEENISLIGYAWKLWNENKAENVAFTRKLYPICEMEIQRCVQVGLLCVQDSPNDRPNMSNVLSMLNSEIVSLPLPKLPVYTAELSLSEDYCYPQTGSSYNDVSLTAVQGR